MSHTLDEFMIDIRFFEIEQLYLIHIQTMRSSLKYSTSYADGLWDGETKIGKENSYWNLIYIDVHTK